MDERPSEGQAEAEKASLKPSPSIASVNPEMEKRLLKKLDWILLPLFTAIREPPTPRPSLKVMLMHL
jgi:hypothetical protein